MGREGAGGERTEGLSRRAQRRRTPPSKGPERQQLLKVPHVHLQAKGNREPSSIGTSSRDHSSKIVSVPSFQKGRPRCRNWEKPETREKSSLPKPPGKRKNSQGCLSQGKERDRYRKYKAAECSTGSPFEDCMNQRKAGNYASMAGSP